MYYQELQKIEAAIKTEDTCTVDLPTGKVGTAEKSAGIKEDVCMIDTSSAYLRAQG
jgi:hypothetical protein